MPRRNRNGDRRGVPLGIPVEPGADDHRRDRAQVFERTKMCKFHILGCCSRGAACHFAHNKEELMSQPDLARTKLCKTLISTGQCTDPECRYAHSKEEMRLVLGFNCPTQNPVGSSATSVATAPASAPERSDGLLQQHAMQQLAEAAQAHAAEAMRLQAMAACLHVQGAGAGLPAQFAGAPFVPTAQGAALGGCGFPGQAMHFTPAATLAAPSPGGGGGGLAAQGAHANAGAPPGAGAAPGKGGKGQRGARGERGAKGKGRGDALKGGKDRTDPNAGHFSRGPGSGPPSRPPVSGVLDLDQMTSGPSMSSGAHFPLMGSGFLPQGWQEGGAPGSYLQGHTEPANMASGSMGAMPSQGAPTDAFTPSEPAQIHPMSLRSLSNCSLVDLAKAAEESHGQTQPSTPLMGGGHTNALDMSTFDGSASLGWTVKNTFLDFREATPSTPGRLRPICSAAGRLDALAHGSTSPSPEMGPHDDPFMDPYRGLTRPQQSLPPSHEDAHGFGQPARGQQPSLLAEKRAQDTPLAVGQAPPRSATSTTSPQWPAGQLAGHAAACGTTGPLRMGAVGAVGGEADAAQPPATITEAGERQGEPSESSSSPAGAVAGDAGHWGGGPLAPQSSAAHVAGRAAPLLAEGITVKNTFLDFAMPEPAAALRAVQTAAGRLDLLVHEDDDED